MRSDRCFLLALAGWFLGGLMAWAQTSVPLVLSGGTVVDVTNWGHSAADLPNAVVIIQNGKIEQVGPAISMPVPKGARVIDCSGKYIIPGLIDGFAGISTQGEASANLYMGVTTAVVRSDSRHGRIDPGLYPSPHVYPIDSVGTTDDWSLLIGHSGWTERLRQNGRAVELPPDETLQQLTATKALGTRVVYIGPNVTAANTQWIITRAHQMGMMTYGQFVATPFRVGIEAGVDALVHMGSYELGAVPDELQQPLAADPEGSAANTAFDYAERVPPTDLHVRTYAKLVGSHHAALMPTFATFFLRLPDHRNLWEEPVAALLDPAHMSNPPDRKTGEINYPLPQWTRRLPAIGQRYMEDRPAEEGRPVCVAFVAHQPGSVRCVSALPGGVRRAGGWVVPGHITARGTGTAGTTGAVAARGPGSGNQQLRDAVQLDGDWADCAGPACRCAGSGRGSRSEHLERAADQHADPRGQRGGSRSAVEEVIGSGDYCFRAACRAAIARISGSRF